MIVRIRSNWVAALGLTLFLGALIRITQADDEIWKKCSTPRTHYVLEVPGSLVASKAPGVADCSYQTPDGEFTVEAAEETGERQTIDARLQKEIGMLGATVTDQKKGDNWFAVTGVTTDGTEFYRLHYTNGAQWVSLRITYPHSKAKKYDKWVERIDKDFVAFGNEGKPNDNSEKKSDLRRRDVVPQPRQPMEGGSASPQPMLR